MNKIKKTKVLQIVPSFAIAGAEKVVYDYLTNYDKERYEFRAISLYPELNNHHCKGLNINKVKVKYLNKEKGFEPRLFIKIYKEIKNFKPDIIHSHMSLQKYLIYSYLAFPNVKKFHTIHSDPIKDSKGISRLFNKIMFKFFNVTPIVLTEEFANLANDLYKVNNSVVLPNGINMDKFINNKLSIKNAKYNLNIPTDKFVIGHVGRFTKSKNHIFIVNIFKDLILEKPNSILVFVGDGPEKKNIETIVNNYGLNENVIFLGIRDDIPDVLRAFDIFIFPSTYEGFPISLIEAQASNLKSVISDNIDRSNILSRNTVSLSLDSPKINWIEELLKSSAEQNKNEILKYDIKIIMKELGKIYEEN